MGYDVRVQFFECTVSVVPGSAEAHYVQFYGISSSLRDSPCKLFPFAVGMTGDGSNHRNRAHFLGLAYEIQIIGKNLIADIS